MQLNGDIRATLIPTKPDLIPSVGVALATLREQQARTGIPGLVQEKEGGSDD